MYFHRIYSLKICTLAISNVHRVKQKILPQYNVIILNVHRTKQNLRCLIWYICYYHVKIKPRNDVSLGEYYNIF